MILCQLYSVILCDVVFYYIHVIHYPAVLDHNIVRYCTIILYYVKLYYVILDWDIYIHNVVWWYIYLILCCMFWFSKDVLQCRYIGLGHIKIFSDNYIILDRVVSYYLSHTVLSYICTASVCYVANWISEQGREARRTTDATPRPFAASFKWCIRFKAETRNPKPLNPMWHKHRRPRSEELNPNPESCRSLSRLRFRVNPKPQTVIDPQNDC